MLTRLIYCPPNIEIEIRKIDGGYGAQENVESLGLAVGSKVKILHSQNGRGPIDLSHKNGLAAIGRELAAKVIVDIPIQPQLTLDRIRIGDVVKVTKITSNGDIRFRLLDMGLVRGAVMKVIRLAPLGDPIEVRLDGFNLSLRRNEAAGIHVEVIRLGLNEWHKNSV